MSTKDKTNDHTKLRARLLRVVGAEDGELLWESLREHGVVKDYFFDAESSEAEAWTNFESRARLFAADQRRFRESSLGHRTRREEIPVAASRHDERMAEAYSALLAREAAADPLVKRFRERELGDKLLTAEEVEEYRKNDYRRVLPADSEWAEKYIEQGFVPSLVTGRKEHPWIVDEDTTLGDVAGYLAYRYPWDEVDAAYFVLTGEAPAVMPVKLMYDPNKESYILEVQPWASKAALGEAHRAIHGGRTNRSIGAGTLTLLGFVDEHTDQDGNRPTWEELRKLWNDRGLGRHYGDYPTFSKAYRRARDKLAPRRSTTWT